jgi:hypothetical protein
VAYLIDALRCEDDEVHILQIFVALDGATIDLRFL